MNGKGAEVYGDPHLVALILSLATMFSVRFVEFVAIPYVELIISYSDSVLYMCINQTR